MSGAEPRGGWAPLRVRDFRLFLTGVVLREPAMPLQFVTQIFWLQDRADPAWMLLLVGLIGTARGFGMLLFGLFGGALADRFDRRRLLIAVQAAMCGIAIAIAAVMAVPDPGPLPIVAFFALVFASAVLYSIDGPARLALIPDLTGRALAPAGLGLYTAGMQIAMPVSIFASGFIIAALGFAATHLLSAAGHALEVGFLLRIRSAAAPQREAVRGSALQAAFRDVREGLAYAFAHPLVLWVVALVVSLFVLGFPATANLGPTWITTVVGVPYREFGYVAVSWGLGALAASLLMTRLAELPRKGVLLVIAALGFAASFCVFSAARTPLMASLGNLGLGSGMAASQIASLSLLQASVPNRVRGRVLGLPLLGMGLAQVLTTPLAALGGWLTLELLFAGLAALTVLAVAAIALGRPVIWRARLSAQGSEVELVHAALRPASAAPAARAARQTRA